MTKPMVDNVNYVHGQITAIDWLEEEQVLLAGEANLLHVYTDVLNLGDAKCTHHCVSVFPEGRGSIHGINHSSKLGLDGNFTYRRVLLICGYDSVCCWLERNISACTVRLVQLQYQQPRERCRLLTGKFIGRIQEPAPVADICLPDSGACIQFFDTLATEQALFVTVHGELALYQQCMPTCVASCGLKLLIRSNAHQLTPTSGPEQLFYSGCIIDNQVNISNDASSEQRQLFLIAGTAFGEMTVWLITINIISDAGEKRHDRFRITTSIVCCLPGAHSGEIFYIVPYRTTTRSIKLATVSGDRCAKLWLLNNDRFEQRINESSSASSSSADLQLLATFGGVGSESGHNSRLWRCAISENYLVCVGEDACCSIWSIGHLISDSAESATSSTDDDRRYLYTSQPVEMLTNLHLSINIWSLIAVEMPAGGFDNHLAIFTGGHDGAIWLTNLALSRAPSVCNESSSMKLSSQSAPDIQASAKINIGRLHAVRLQNNEQAKLLAFLPTKNALVVLCKQGSLFIASRSSHSKEPSVAFTKLGIRAESNKQQQNLDVLNAVIARNAVTALAVSSKCNLILLSARNSLYIMRLETSPSGEDFLALYSRCCITSNSACQIRIMQEIAALSDTDAAQYFIIGCYDGSMHRLKINAAADGGEFDLLSDFASTVRADATAKVQPTPVTVCAQLQMPVGAAGAMSLLILVGTRDGSLLLVHNRFDTSGAATVPDTVQKFHWPLAPAASAGCSDAAESSSSASPSPFNSSSSSSSGGGVCDILYPIPKQMVLCCCRVRKNAEAIISDSPAHFKADRKRQFLTLGRDDGVLAQWSIEQRSAELCASLRGSRRDNVKIDALKMKLVQVYRITCCKTLLSFIVSPGGYRYDDSDLSSPPLRALGFRANQLVVVDLLRDYCLVALDGVGGPNRCIDYMLHTGADNVVDVAFTFGDAFVWHSMPCGRQRRKCLLKPLHGHEINALAWVRNIDCRELMSSQRVPYFLTASEDCTLNLCRLPSADCGDADTSNKHVDVLATLRGHLSSVRCVKALRMPYARFRSLFVGAADSENRVFKDDNEILTLVVSGGGRCQLKVWCIFGLEEGEKIEKARSDISRAVFCTQVASFMPLPLVKKRWHESTQVPLDSDVRIMDCDVVVVDENMTIGTRRCHSWFFIIAVACSDGGFMLFRLIYSEKAAVVKHKQPTCDELRLMLCTGGGRGGRLGGDFQLKCYYASAGAHPVLNALAARNCCLQRIRIVSVHAIDQDNCLLHLVTTGTDGIVELLIATCSVDTGIKENSGAGDGSNVACRSLSRVKVHQSGISALDIRRMTDTETLDNVPKWFVSGGDDGCICVGVLRYNKLILAEESEATIDVRFSRPDASLTKISGLRWLMPAEEPQFQENSTGRLMFAAVSQQQECVVWQVNLVSGALEALQQFQLQTADINAFDISVTTNDTEISEELMCNFAFGGRGLEIHKLTLKTE